MSNESEPHPTGEELSGDESPVSATCGAKSTPASTLKKSRKHRSDKKKKKNAQKSADLSLTEQELYATHADAIRANAKQLLNTEISPSTNRYRSYHDSPATFVSSDSASTSLPPWTAGSNAQSSYGVDDALSVSQVASMAFNCISHCVAEGYRAASNYYSTYQRGEKFDHTYEQVGRREDVGSASPIVGSGGYQNASGHQKQLMERGPPSTSSENLMSGQVTEQSSFQVKGEYANVMMPSTYQGGNHVHVLK